MKLILTDNPKECPGKIPEGYCLVQVDNKTIIQYDGNAEVEIVLCSRGLAKDLLAINLPSCKLVQLFSVGYDNVNLSKYKERAIPLCNAAGIYDNVLAEYVVYSMLLYAKRFHHSLKNRWFRPLRNYHYMTEIAGKTVGVMGCGRIGTAVARHLSGFGVTIIGYTKHTKEKVGFSKIYYEESINEFFSESDFVINTLPHNESTIGLIINKVLASAKPNITFINIGRDSVFSGNDFYYHLKAHKDTTAILDMFELFPNPITNKYRRLSNVLVMPRVASISKESEDALKQLLSDNMIAAISGGELKNRII